MKVTRRPAVTVFCVLALGCAGGGPWQDACGCASVASGLMGDLNLDLPANAALTPLVLEKAVESYLLSHHLAPTMQNLSLIGPTFTQGCDRSGKEIICTFWLWERPGAERGLRLTVPYCDCGPPTGAIPGIKAVYVKRDA